MYTFFLLSLIVTAQMTSKYINNMISMLDLEQIRDMFSSHVPLASGWHTMSHEGSKSNLEMILCYIL